MSTGCEYLRVNYGFFFQRQERKNSFKSDGNYSSLFANPIKLFLWSSPSIKTFLAAVYLTLPALRSALLTLEITSIISWFHRSLLSKIGKPSSIQKSLRHSVKTLLNAIFPSRTAIICIYSSIIELFRPRPFVSLQHYYYSGRIVLQKVCIVSRPDFQSQFFLEIKPFLSTKVSGFLCTSWVALSTTVPQRGFKFSATKKYWIKCGLRIVCPVLTLCWW